MESNCNYKWVDYLLDWIDEDDETFSLIINTYDTDNLMINIESLYILLWFKCFLMN